MNRRPKFTSALCLFATCVTAAQAAPDRIEPFAADQRLAATYYFDWYVDGKTVRPLRAAPGKGQNVAHLWTWQPYYPTGDEPGAAIFGLDDPAKWQRRRLPDTSNWPDSDDWQYHVAELRAMKYAGLDFVFVDVWYPGDFHTSGDTKGADLSRASRPNGGKRSSRMRSGSPQGELSALFQAWKYLDRNDEEPIKLALMVDTASFKGADLRGAPDASGDPDQLFKAVWAFYRQFFGENEYPAVMPVRALAAIRGEHHQSRLVVNLFLPRFAGQAETDWIHRWDADTFDLLRRRFYGMAGVSLYLCVNQHLNGPSQGGWDGMQADGTRVDISRRRGIVDQELTWNASLAGPLIRDDSIAIGAGFFRRCCDAHPGADARDADGQPAYPSAYHYRTQDASVSSYEQQWQTVLAQPENFRKHLVVIESWNELIEGTQLAPAKPETITATDGTYIDRWGETPTQYLDLTRKYLSIWKGK